MRNRRLVVSAVAIAAAGVGFVPGAAHAADPVSPGAQGVAAPGFDVKKAGQAGLQKFASPAGNAVRRTLPAAGKKASALQSADGNPGLSVVLGAEATSAHGFRLVTTIGSADVSLNVVIDWGDGTSDRAEAFGDEVLTSEHVYAEAGEHQAKITVTDPVNQAEIVNELPLLAAGSDFTPYGPTRLLDTRSAIGGSRAKVPAYKSVRVKVAGNGTIPAGVTAVALNVTVTNARSGGHVIAFASGRERPATSNLNFAPGQTVPNLVIVPVGKDGYVELYNGGWDSIDLIADVTGYFSRTQASGYTPSTPVRVVDTREGIGRGGKRGQVAGQGSFKIQFPRGLYTAVALNVTVTNPRDAGHLTAYPSDQPVPTTSNLNFLGGQTVANSVIVPVAADGSVTIRNGAWQPTDVVIDLVGNYGIDSAGSLMTLNEPGRVLDTRAANSDGPAGARGYYAVPLSPGVPGVAGYVLNTTVTNTRGPGFLSVAPDPNSAADYENGTNVWPERPVSSTLNWTKGATVPNLAQASSGNNGIVDFWNQGWEPTDLIVDIFGYYETN
ncbi:hypothetical protein ACFVX6_38915 [Streptomyces sp. NPDC058289]|uniref:hypothetical protein n=1 Tax=Streptomyces sp. NPDC058289 TaxID=3346425 RepID=UPI0036E26D7C